MGEVKVETTFRQTGRTTKQMQDAPVGSVFIWCNNRLGYPKMLAHELGREDLKIVGPSWLTDRRYQGLRVPAILLDHALVCTSNQFEELYIGRLHAVRRNS